MRLLPALAVSSLLLATVLTGCRVTSHKNGNNDNVSIGTPFGSMQVKTNDNVNAMGLGITPYPGAEMVKKHNKDGDNDNGAADVNMSFGSFHLGVKAVSYTTPDSQEKVLAFYKNDLKKFGDVLECEGSRTIGQPARTSEGLTCSDGAHVHGHVHWDGDDEKVSSDAKTELRAGSKQHRHIVAIEKHDGGTKIGLVALDLPTDLDSDHHKDSD
jgi:hypothetical protein